MYVSTTKTHDSKNKKKAPWRSVQILSCFSRPKATHNIQGTYPPARKPVEVDSEHPPLFTGLFKNIQTVLCGISEPSTVPILWNIQCLICWMWVVNGNLWKFGLVQKTPSGCLKHLQAFTEMSFHQCFFVSGIQGKLETPQNRDLFFLCTVLWCIFLLWTSLSQKSHTHIGHSSKSFSFQSLLENQQVGPGVYLEILIHKSNYLG